MAVELPSWEEVATAPEKHVAALEVALDEAQEEVKAIRVRLRAAQKVLECKADVEYLNQYGTPRPKGNTADPDHSDEEAEAARGRGPEDGASGTRKVQVVQLLGQQPERRWKAMEIAQALGITNIKSLRSSLDDFARGGVIRKNRDDKTYQALNGTADG
ncbi:hypothetical protein [Streptomyces acidiscabies]|uniref:hypothetical protein n=1 Tax=Streptomyces acidiscabies TaxID=42234 RepID=UPI00117CD595|nr:hypothetical protein [Streptomyces acidiscabies]